MNPAWRATVASLAIAVGSGCSIPYTNEQAGPQTNTCSQNSDCGGTDVCVAQMCVGTDVSLSGLILDVHPNSGASFGAASSFLIPVTTEASLDGSTPQGFNASFDGTLPPLVAIAGGTVTLGYASDCALAADKSYPAKLEFTRVTPEYLGLPAEQYFATSAAVAGEAPPSYQFTVALPPGSYDVYAEPQAIAGCIDAAPPPTLFAGQKIGGAGPFTWSITKARTLVGDIAVPDAADLNGWLLDIVEPAQGRVVSTTQTLQQGELDLSVQVQLDFAWADDQSSPIIRLRPPASLHEPSVYWGLWEALASSSASNPEVHLSVSDLVVDPRIVRVQVQDASHANVVASVSIASTSLSGDVASNAAYSWLIPETDSTGAFTAQLPPGQYRVRVTPLLDDSLAVTQTTLEVPPLAQGASPTCFCGHAITVASKMALTGTLTGGGLPFGGAAIVASPSQTTDLSYWSEVHALDPLLPRQASGVVNAHGAFALGVDPGTSDFSVRPDEGAGFPWLIRPGLAVQATSNLSLGSLVLESPAVLSGWMRDPTGAPVAKGTVDAWLPLQNPADAGVTGAVIQIATSTTDESGYYRLLLPTSVAP